MNYAKKQKGRCAIVSGQLFSLNTPVEWIAIRTESACLAGTIHDEIQLYIRDNQRFPVTGLDAAAYIVPTRVRLECIEGGKLYGDGIVCYTQPTIFEVHVTGRLK